MGVDAVGCSQWGVRDVTAMTFLQAAGIAMIPSLVWGWFFVSRNPESRQLVVVTFLLGTLAVVPLLLFMAGLGVQLQSHEAAAVQRAWPGPDAAGAQHAGLPRRQSRWC